MQKVNLNLWHIIYMLSTKERKRIEENSYKLRKAKINIFQEPSRGKEGFDSTVKTFSSKGEREKRVLPNQLRLISDEEAACVLLLNIT